MDFELHKKNMDFFYVLRNIVLFPVKALFCIIYIYTKKDAGEAKKVDH